MKPSQIVSFKAVLNQEIQFDDKNEVCLDNLSIDELNNKVEMYNKLFLENKINDCNAFEIHLISCVQRMVRKTKQTNFLEISNTFDAMSKVYTCRVDDFYNAGKKLVKEFLAETKTINDKSLSDNDTRIKRVRKKVMLTEPEKLCQKENQLFKIKYLNNNIDDVIDYVNPSRIILNKFSNKTYWPEYNFSNVIQENENHQEKYEIENLYNLIQRGKICPGFDQFVAERDKNTYDDTLDTLDNISGHFDRETSKFNDFNMLNADDSEEVHKLVDINIVEKNIKKINDESTLLYHPNKSSSNHDSILLTTSQLSSIANTDYNDYTFFDPKQLNDFQCPSHWKNKFKMMTMTNKQKILHIKQLETGTCDNDNQKHFETNVSVDQFKRTENDHYKIDFTLNMTERLDKLSNEIGIHRCRDSLWKQSNNIISDTNDSTLSPVRRLEFCKYINVIPRWYKNTCTELDNSTLLFPEKDIETENGNVPKIKENNQSITIIDSNHVHESYKNKSFAEDDNNLSSHFNENNSKDIHNEFGFPSGSPGYIDMHKLKQILIKIIKPDDHITMNISFKNLLLRLPELLPENMIDNISVQIVFVALLHLCNEYNLHLENNNNQIMISQG